MITTSSQAAFASCIAALALFSAASAILRISKTRLLVSLVVNAKLLSVSKKTPLIYFFMNNIIFNCIVKNFTQTESWSN